jgi:xanthosine utilization system XapX-like protein
LDVKGMSNGNQGPFKGEVKYRLIPGQSNPPEGKSDADIIWRFDMRAELSVFPHNITSSSVLIVGDLLYVNTSNGVDWSHRNIPSPTAPALVVLNKNTGELVGEEASNISKRLLHGNWASPSYAKIKSTPMVVFGGGDGWVYGFKTQPELNEQGFEALKELWRFDANPAAYRLKEGKKVRYTRYDGPSEIIASPVIHNDRVYTVIGQDPEHGPGLGGSKLCGSV